MFVFQFTDNKRSCDTVTQEVSYTGPSKKICFVWAGTQKQ